MTLILSRQEVEELLTMPMTLEAVEGSFREQGLGRTQVPERISLLLEEEHGAIGAMLGYLGGPGIAGAKVISHFEHNLSQHGLPSIAGLIIYHDLATGLPLAIMDCGVITRMRTGAASAVSAKYLARADAAVVGIVGTGAVAEPHIRALCQVRNIRRVQAFGLDAQAMARFLDSIGDLRLEIVTVEDAEKACAGADILVTCTPARAAFVRGEWIKPGMHIAAVGADMPPKRELSPDVYARADKWVVDLPAQALRTGEVADAIAAGAIRLESLHATLGEIVAGVKPGRQNDAEITLYKSTGIAIQDVATAGRVYQAARARGIGIDIAITP